MNLLVCLVQRLIHLEHISGCMSEVRHSLINDMLQCLVQVSSLSRTFFFFVTAAAFESSCLYVVDLFVCFYLLLAKMGIDRDWSKGQHCKMHCGVPNNICIWDPLICMYSSCLSDKSMCIRNIFVFYNLHVHGSGELYSHISSAKIVEVDLSLALPVTAWLSNLGPDQGSHEPCTHCPGCLGHTFDISDHTDLSVFSSTS